MTPKGRATRADTRPWGRWEVLLEEPAYKLKRIVVRPGQRLSYQKHAFREEHWTVAQGAGVVTLDGKLVPLKAGDTITIPKGSPHRMSNPGRLDLVFIELQLGSYFGEDDIVRLEDDYGRLEPRPSRRPAAAKGRSR